MLRGLIYSAVVFAVAVIAAAVITLAGLSASDAWILFQGGYVWSGVADQPLDLTTVAGLLGLAVLLPFTFRVTRRRMIGTSETPARDHSPAAAGRIVRPAP